MNTEIGFSYVNDQVVVSSLEVAKNFEKRHDKLISEIKRMYFEYTNEGYVQNGGDPLFYKTTYTNEQNNQEYPMYLMNRDGFSLLVMGFTGKKALDWKLKYIEVFNENERKSRVLEYTQRSTSIGETARLSKEIRITGEKAGVNPVTIADSLCKLWRMNGLVLNEFEHEIQQLKNKNKKPVQLALAFIPDDIR